MCDIRLEENRISHIEFVDVGLSSERDRLIVWIVMYWGSIVGGLS